MAQVDSQETEIRGVRYRVRMLDPLKANDILIDLLAILGPSIGALGGKAVADGSISGLLDSEDSPSFERAVSSFVQRLDKATFRRIVDELAKHTEFSEDDGEKWPRLSDQMQIHFRGRLGQMYRWLWFALKVQFADFFDGIESVTSLAERFVGPRSQAPSPNTSTDTR